MQRTGVELGRDVADVTGQVGLRDASTYDPAEFEPPSSPGQLRPFFSLKSALYVGDFCPAGAGEGDAGIRGEEGEDTTSDAAAAPIRVAVKFWLCRDESVENEVCWNREVLWTPGGGGAQVAVASFFKRYSMCFVGGQAGGCAAERGPA